MKFTQYNPVITDYGRSFPVDNLKQRDHVYDFRFFIPRKKRKTGTLFTISYIKNVAISEIHTIHKNCPATPPGNFRIK